MDLQLGDWNLSLRMEDLSLKMNIYIHIHNTYIHNTYMHTCIHHYCQNFSLLVLCFGLGTSNKVVSFTPKMIQCYILWSPCCISSLLTMTLYHIQIPPFCPTPQIKLSESEITVFNFLICDFRNSRDVLSQDNKNVVKPNTSIWQMGLWEPDGTPLMKLLI